MVRAESLPQRGCRSGYTEHRPVYRRSSTGQSRGRSRRRRDTPDGPCGARMARTAATASSIGCARWMAPSCLGTSPAAAPPTRQVGAWRSPATAWMTAVAAATSDSVSDGQDHDRCRGLANGGDPTGDRDVRSEIQDRQAGSATADREREGTELMLGIRRCADDHLWPRTRNPGGIEEPGESAPDRFAGGMLLGDVDRAGGPCLADRAQGREDDALHGQLEAFAPRTARQARAPGPGCPVRASPPGARRSPPARARSRSQRQEDRSSRGVARTPPGGPPWEPTPRSGSDRPPAADAIPGRRPTAASRSGGRSTRRHTADSPLGSASGEPRRTGAPMPGSSRSAGLCASTFGRWCTWFVKRSTLTSLDNGC